MEKPLNRIIEIHDSKLAGITAKDRDVVLHLEPAYVHQSEGEPGVAKGTGWVQDIDIVISDATVESSISEIPVDLWDGSFSVGDDCRENIIPLPLAVSDAVTLVFITIRDERLVVRGTGALTVPRGDLRYVEEYPEASND